MTTTLGSPNSGDSVVGSAANTSSAAPAMRPSRTRVGQRGLVDDAAAGRVDDPQRRLRVREQVGRDQAHRVGRLREVDREEVGLADEVLERGDERHAELPGAVGTHVRVEGHELHAERQRALGDEHADAAEADDAERLAVELDALPPACGSTRRP